MPCFRARESGARLLVKRRVLGVPGTLFPLLKGELKGEEALDGPKSARPAGRTMDVCRGLLAEMPVGTQGQEQVSRAAPHTPS